MIPNTEINIEIPAIAIPETRVYAHRTRMADFDRPAVELILKPADEIRCHTVVIQLTEGVSRTHIEWRTNLNTPIERIKYAIKHHLHRREPVIDIGANIAIDLRFSDTGNYAHLIHDVLGPLRMIEQRLMQESSEPVPPIHMVLPKKAPPIALKVLEFAGVPVICTDGAVRGRLLTITQELNIALLPYLVHQQFESPAATTPERIFVSRRGARTVLNEEDVMELLTGEGYERIYMEDLPIAEQWSTLANAKEIVGIHGAGLASLGFSIQRPIAEGPRFRLIELFSPGFSSTCFRQYAAALGGTWVGVRGKVTPEIVRDLDLLGLSRAHDQASFEVDIESLSQALAYSRLG